MNRDVYICYGDKQEEISEAICDLFKDNNIQSWIKSRDFPSNDADKIVNAIATSKCFVLILSNNSNSNHILRQRFPHFQTQKSSWRHWLERLPILWENLLEM